MSFFEPFGLGIQPSDFAGIYHAPQPPSGQKTQDEKHDSGYGVIPKNRRCLGSEV